MVGVRSSHLRCCDKTLRDAMKTPLDPVYGPDDLNFNARTISLAVSTIRRAQGKLLPRDCQEGTTEWRIAMEEFAQDVMRALEALL